MNSFELPLTSPQITCSEALRLMQEHGTSAVVAITGTAAFLVRGRELTASMRRYGDVPVSVSALEIGRPLDMASSTGLSFGSVSRSITETDFSRHSFAEGSANFSLMQAHDGRAVITVPSGISATDMQLRIVICRCPEDDSHVWEASELNGVINCEFDGELLVCS